MRLRTFILCISITLILLIASIYTFEKFLITKINENELSAKTASHLSLVYGILSTSLNNGFSLEEAARQNNASLGRVFNGLLYDDSSLKELHILKGNTVIASTNIESIGLEFGVSQSTNLMSIVKSKNYGSIKLTIASKYTDDHIYIISSIVRPISVALLIVSIFMLSLIASLIIVRNRLLGNALNVRNENLIKGTGYLERSIRELITYTLKQESLNKSHQIQLANFKDQVTALTQQSQQQTEKLTGQFMAPAEITTSVIQDSHLPEAKQTTLRQIHQNVALLHHSLDRQDEAIDTMSQTISQLSNDFTDIASTLQTQAATVDSLEISNSEGGLCDKTLTHELTSLSPESPSVLDSLHALKQQTDVLKTRELPVLEAHLNHLALLKEPVAYVERLDKRVKIEDHRNFPFRTLPLNFSPGQEISILVFDAARQSELVYRQYLNNDLRQNDKGHPFQFRYHVMGQKYTVQDIVDIVDELDPDVVFLEVDIPADSKPHAQASTAHGLKALIDLHTNFETLPIVIVTKHTNPVLASRCIGLGARSFIPKQHGDLALPFRLDAILQNDLVLAGVSGLNYLTFNKYQVGLSPAENEVLGLFLLGKTNKEIGQALGKSESTVENQITSLRAKLGLSKENLLKGFYDNMALF